MDVLPEEIIINIFEYCLRSELLNLTIVCKRFNEIISNNANFMKELYIDIRRNHKDIEWNGTRKYTKLMVHKLHMELPKIIDSMQNDLTDLRFALFKINGMEFKKILFKLPKLKCLGMSEVDFELTNECFEEPLPKLELDVLNVSNINRNILKMLMNCQTKSYGSYRVSYDEGELEAYQAFLKNQKQLEKFYLHGFCRDQVIFQDGQLNKVDFRLKTLVIRNMRECEDIQNFLEFLKNHRESLVSFDLFNPSLLAADKISTMELMNCLGKFWNLSNLSISRTPLNFEPMPYVKKLSLSSAGVVAGESFHDKFPNVKDLTIGFTLIVKDIENMKNLETLRLSSYDKLVELKIPLSVKTLELTSIYPEKERPFDYENHNIENFIFKHCTSADWIGDFLKSLKTKLKFLKIERCFLSRYRRFARLFENEPELQVNKAEHFIFIDFKDEYDEDSIASDAEEESINGIEEEIDYLDYGVDYDTGMDYEYEESGLTEDEYEYLNDDDNISGDLDNFSEDDDQEGPSNDKKMKLNEN